MSTKVSTPSAPAAPSTGDAVESWVKNLPKIYETQMQYAPLEAQQQMELAQQYALPLAQIYQQAQATLYPETTAIQEEFAQQALQGSQQGLSDAERSQYQDYFRSNLGTNAGSGMGANYVGKNMLQMEQQRKDYYRDLGLSLAGRQPLAQPTTPGYSNYMSGFTPNSVMDYTQQGYGSYSSLYGNMYNANANATASMNKMFGQIGGGAMSGLGTMLAAPAP